MEPINKDKYTGPRRNNGVFDKTIEPHTTMYVSLLVHSM